MINENGNDNQTKAPSERGPKKYTLYGWLNNDNPESYIELMIKSTFYIWIWNSQQVSTELMFKESVMETCSLQEDKGQCVLWKK